RGSAWVDLVTSTSTHITDTKIHLLPTGVFGPLEQGYSALLLGHSSATLQGLFVLPGVIDSNHTREIQIVVRTSAPPCFITKGSRIAQLIYFKAFVPQANQQDRGTGGFGSTGQPLIAWTQTIMGSRPMLTCMLINPTGQCVNLTAILDTGADISIIS
ncbi:POK9 protein, partial [Crotophaga sulcirostris]|nr:POK9 protein [Crotophaga sulcirostris]